MADPKKSEKTIEMRLAEIEDKLSQLHITEEEMKTYQKVANALGMGAQGGAAPVQAAGPTPGISTHPIARSIGPIGRVCIIRYVCQCICPCGPGFCNECTCGPCNCAGGGGGFGGGFGGFGG
jgi:hypothetical protein